jgi:hypothetical protein
VLYVLLRRSDRMSMPVRISIVVQRRKRLSALRNIVRDICKESDF